MRLIDANNLQFNGRNYNKSQMRAILDFIDAQPTVYAPDKVLDQLWDASFERFGCDAGMGGELVVNMDDAIEIVKAGGIDVE